jgi:molecular chaperone GrpE
MTDESSPVDPTTLQTQVTALQQQIETLKQALTAAQADSAPALKELAARAQADLQNAKERLEREAQELRRFAAAGLLTDLLPVIDTFRRAFDHLPDDLQAHEWVNGIAAVEKEFMKRLTDLGLQPIQPLGQPVDPQRHEILQAGPGEKDIITAVYEDGYELHGRLLRPARVQVGDGSSAT